ncbi:hypothetical protein Tco_0150962 [Tanacetum coccineum]
MFCCPSKWTSPKEKDPGSFILPCAIGTTTLSNALAELGESISIMPFSLFKRLGLGNPKPINMVIEMADRKFVCKQAPVIFVCLVENCLYTVFPTDSSEGHFDLPSAALRLCSALPLFRLLLLYLPPLSTRLCDQSASTDSAVRSYRSFYASYEVLVYAVSARVCVRPFSLCCCDVASAVSARPYPRF